MFLRNRIMVNLSCPAEPNLLGHISVYDLSCGNTYYVYSIEQQFYAAKEICKDTGRVVSEESSDNDYHYRVDLFFNDKSRYMGWNAVRGTHCSD